MTKRLYYTDAYITRFRAAVVEQFELDGRSGVVLDQTFFYPISGGQPADRGTIHGIPVQDVSIRDEDGAILHWLERGLPPAAEVTAEIDWRRRFDFMQHHTGQHILSQSFIRTAEANTVSFHLSDDSATIDLEASTLTPEQLQAAELLANEIVWEDRRINIRFGRHDEVSQMALRRAPVIEGDELRLIEIDSFDVSACGGTHVSSTGQVGSIKILRLERRGGQSRVEFCCGRRSLQDHGRKNSILNQLTASLTTGQSEVVGAVERLQEEVKQAQRMLKKQRSDLLRIEADELLKAGKHVQGICVVSQVLTDVDPADLRELGAHLTRNEGVMVLLGMAGPKSQLLFSRSADVPGEMDVALKEAMAILGPAAKGGGNATFAQGGGPEASPERVAQAIAQAEQILLRFS